jgi:transposase-like protein
MQSLHPFRGSIEEYLQELSDPDRYRLDHCPLCPSPEPLRAHGFYSRTVVDVQYDGTIRVRRYLCLLCRRTVSLLPEFVLPYLRFSIQVIGLFLVSRLLHRRTLRQAAGGAFQPDMPYQRGQFWLRRFHQQAQALCAALASLTTVVPARDFLTRALQMLEAIGWIPAHRFLFAELRAHLLGWPRFLVPHGCPFPLLPVL